MSRAKRAKGVLDELVREFAERVDGLVLAKDIGREDVPYIVDALVHEMRQKRVVVMEAHPYREGDRP